jgi:hypothetical protein
LEIKRPKREAFLKHLSSVEVNNSWSYTHIADSVNAFLYLVNVLLISLDTVSELIAGGKYCMYIQAASTATLHFVFMGFV